MKVFTAPEIRNVAILGHSGSGKTTMTEAALYAAGVTNRLGKVDEGNTVSDYDQEEIRRKVSCSTSVIPVEWHGKKINFMDTPGYFDFIGEVKEALYAADLALIMVSAKSGVEVGTEKAWEYASDVNIPKMFFINGMDDDNADYERVLGELKEHFGSGVAPLHLPVSVGGKFAGFADVVNNVGFTFSGGAAAKGEIPAELAGEADEKRLAIEEAIAESDEELMEKFFADERFTRDEIITGLKNGLKENMISPVLCGAVSQSIGAEALLDTLIKIMPPASEAKPQVAATNIKTDEEAVVKCDAKEPYSAFVFKTIADPYVGRLSIFKVYSGSIRRETVIYNTETETSEKAGHVYIMRGKEQIEVDEIMCGDIGAIAKLTNTGTGHSLCQKDRPVRFAPIAFPESLFSMAIAPKTKGDEDKISMAFAKLSEEDKTVKFEINPETKQSVVYGIGDNQLDVLVNKLRNKYKLEVELLPPVIQYREMIKSKVKKQGKYKKQSGGHGQYGDVHIEFEPSGDLTQPYIFEEKIVGGVVPRQYFPAVEKGIQDCVKAGPIAGYPVVGLKATLVFGSYHSVDSSEMAFKMATYLAFKEGFMEAKPTLLEPIMRIEVTVPDDYTGDIMGDLNKRRGRILGMDKNGAKQVIQAEAPMAEILKYTIELRAMTQGRGSYTLSFERYDETPSEIAQKVIEYRKKEQEQDK